MPVWLVLPIPGEDHLVESDLPGQYAVSAEIRGAIKAVPGVQVVVEFEAPATWNSGSHGEGADTMRAMMTMALAALMT